MRRHIEYFRSSGKFCMAYMERAGEKEYYLASVSAEGPNTLQLKRLQLSPRLLIHPLISHMHRAFLPRPPAGVR